MSSVLKRVAVPLEDAHRLIRSNKLQKLLRPETQQDNCQNGGCADVMMSLRCVECKKNVADSRQGIALAFFEDGSALHLVLRLSDLGKKGACFSCKDVTPEKMPSDKNPYASTSHILCDNVKSGGKKCGKKVGAVKCMPPHSDYKLIFFTYKAVLVDGVKYKSWKEARASSLGDVKVIPPSKVDIGRKFDASKKAAAANTGTAGGTAHLGVTDDDEAADAWKGQIRTRPRAYQLELFNMAVTSEVNSLVYLPTGLGKTLVSVMVVRRILELNPERQAVFLVETNALAIQQADELRSETKCTVEMMVGSSFVAATTTARDENDGPRVANDVRGLQKLVDLRAAKIVVATAGAFEHAMCKEYIDPASICCVVLDEAHHCVREHPFNRVAKQFLVPSSALPPPPFAVPSMPALSLKQRLAALPKLIALTASPAGELTVPGTLLKIEELLGRLGADLAAPVKTIDEVKRRSPRVELKLILTPATSPERHLLRAMEKLVLARIAKLADPSSDVGAQTNFLIQRLQGYGPPTTTPNGSKPDSAKNGTGDSSTPSLATSIAAPLGDESWRFPNRAHTALLQQALQLRARAGLDGGESTIERRAAAAINNGADGGAGGHSEEAHNCVGGGASVLGADGDILPMPAGGHKLIDLLNLCFAVDEIGGDATWQWILEHLVDEAWSSSSDAAEKNGQMGEGENGLISGSHDCDRDDAIRLIKAYLPEEPTGSDVSGMEDDDGEERKVGGASLPKGVSKVSSTVAGAAGMAGEDYVCGAQGSKLKKLASLLEQHKERCDENKTRFSALVFVSTRRLATAVPAMLTAIPGLSEFVSAKSIVGLSEMTLTQQRTSLECFKDGVVNVLVSTSVCGEGIDVPACGLVVCGSLPNSGTALVQLRGRIRCEENCRFLGLSRTCGVADQEHVRTICRRELNMMSVIGRLSARGGGGTPASESSSKTIGSLEGLRDSDTRLAPVKIPSTASASNNPESSADGSSSAVGDAQSSDSDMTDAVRKLREATVQVTNKMNPGEGSKDGKSGADEERGWQKKVGTLLSSTGRQYALQYLSSTTRQTIRRHGQDQNARSCLNCAVQLAQTLKPSVEYDERKVSSESHIPVFEARCLLSSRMEELNGLIMVQEAKGNTIKSAREAAAAMMVQELLSQPTSFVPHEGVQAPSG